MGCIARVALLQLTGALAGFYPSDHFTHVRLLNSQNFERVIRTEVDAGNTAPAWNKVTAEFKSTKGVVFGEINWSEERFDRAFGESQGAGEGGWPTIRHFNKNTGYGGKGYKQKDNSVEVDEELGNEENMRSYVNEKSGISTCDVVWGNDCSAMELKYINQWIGPDVARDKQKITATKEKWETELQAKFVKNFAQNKQRVTILGRILDNFAHPQL